MGLLDRVIERLFRKTPKRKKDEGTALQRYWKSFNHAIDGLIYCVKYEHNMIIIIIATILVIAFGLLFRINIYEWLFVISMIGGIAATECINSAIEATVDLVTTETHPLAKIAKDTASTATLILCTISLIGGLMIFIPKILEVIGV